MKHLKLCLWLACFSALSWPACAAENPFFPLREGSTYAYHGVFKKDNTTREFDEKLVLKSERLQDQEFFYFIEEKDERNPAALIGTRGIGRGIYFNREGEIAALECLIRGQIPFLKFDQSVVILKFAPEPGQQTQTKTADGIMANVWIVEGFEDVTVPAGSFAHCLKLKLEEKVLERRVPEKRLPNGEMRAARVEPEKKLTGSAWLAAGVGLVKWQRVTGRIDELTAYKIADPKTEAKTAGK